MGDVLDRVSIALASRASRRSTLVGLLAGVTALLPWSANAQEDDPFLSDCVTLNGICIPA